MFIHIFIFSATFANLKKSGKLLFTRNHFFVCHLSTYLRKKDGGKNYCYPFPKPVWNMENKIYFYNYYVLQSQFNKKNNFYIFDISYVIFYYYTDRHFNFDVFYLTRLIALHAGANDIALLLCNINYAIDNTYHEWHC